MGLGVGHVLLADTDGIHNHEMIFGHWHPGVTDLQVICLYRSRTPRPFICSKKAAGFYGTHEEDNLYRLDVGAGGDHVHGDGDTGVR